MVPSVRSLRQHQGCGVERRLHRRARGVGAGIVDRSSNEADEWHRGERKDHRDVTFPGACEPAGGCANTTENGCIEHGFHRNVVSAVISALAAKQLVNRFR